jgi:uncharacterized membrane protein HdeD (DUF308 family)
VELLLLEWFCSLREEACVTNLDSAKRPFEVTFLGWLFIAVGIISTIYHLWKGSLDRWTIPIVLVGIIAVTAGTFLLPGARWSRWLLLVWLAFHVVAIALESVLGAMEHLALLVVIGYFLLGPPTTEYFRRAQ